MCRGIPPQNPPNDQLLWCMAYQCGNWISNCARWCWFNYTNIFCLAWPMDFSVRPAITRYICMCVVTVATQMGTAGELWLMLMSSISLSVCFNILLWINVSAEAERPNRRSGLWSRIALSHYGWPFDVWQILFRSVGIVGRSNKCILRSFLSVNGKCILLGILGAMQTVWQNLLYEYSWILPLYAILDGIGRG